MIPAILKSSDLGILSDDRNIAWRLTQRLAVRADERASIFSRVSCAFSRVSCAGARLESQSSAMAAMETLIPGIRTGNFAA